MIYTVTFNPSLDYVVQAEQLVPGEINRTTSEAVCLLYTSRCV